MPLKAYPDLKDLFALRMRGRTARARLSFAEKLEVLEELRLAAQPFAAARDRLEAQSRADRSAA